MDRRDDFDFGRWSRLAASDPERFERERRAAVEAAIAQAPPAMHRRLEGLQWQVDRVRETSAHPLGACVKISRMMWETVAGEHGLLRGLDDLSRVVAGRAPRAPARAAAAVLPFAARRADDEDG